VEDPRGGRRLIKAWGPGLGVRATRRRRAEVGLAAAAAARSSPGRDDAVEGMTGGPGLGVRATRRRRAEVGLAAAAAARSSPGRDDAVEGMTGGPRRSATAGGGGAGLAVANGPIGQLGRSVGSCGSWAAGRGVEWAAAYCCGRLLRGPAGLDSWASARVERLVAWQRRAATLAGLLGWRGCAGWAAG
jgi:hypothetical protein